MRDCVISSTTLVVSVAEISKPGLTIASSYRPSSESLEFGYLRTPKRSYGNLKLKPRGTRNSSSLVDPEESKFYCELELLKEKKKRKNEEDDDNGGDGFELKQKVEDLDSTMLQNGNPNQTRMTEEEDLVPVEESSKDVSWKLWRGRQVMKRSNLMAKQVISIGSAVSLGFVSQLWVDTNSWVVLVVEVRPNLLAGESERFYLEDVNQVGDVVLVENESILENEIRMVGLETLVGYKVETPSRRNIGKVRGYTFNINSGAVESLELDSFGVSIIPSSLVSTYALLVEDVLEVVSDTVVVHEAAASHIQRLTKGFWDTQNVRPPADELADYSDYERPVRYNRGQDTRGGFSSRKFKKKMGDNDVEWELPMDYF